MNKPIVLTVIAQDEPGIVQRVSRVLKAHGGNWTRSSMSSLAGQFAGILLAQVPEETAADCLAALDGLQQEGIRIIAASGDEDAPVSAKPYTLELVGNDRPGIVHDITQILAANGVSVHSLNTEVVGASMSGGELFRAEAELRIPESCDIESLGQSLEALANDLMVDIRFES